MKQNNIVISSRCGLDCTDCKFKAANGCGGCIDTNGNPFYGECQLAICCQNKGHVHCGECYDFPCELLTSYVNDPVHGDDPEHTRIDQCRLWAKKQ